MICWSRTGMAALRSIVRSTMRNRGMSVIGAALLAVVSAACTHVEEERKIEFIYLALGGSDVIGVGATPLTEGYVYLINHDLDIRKPGTFLVTLAVPSARI